MSVNKINLLNLGHDGLEQFIAEMGQPRYRVQQLIHWIHKKGVTEFEQMTNLSREFRKTLEETAEVRPLEVILEQASKDGTRKWLFRLQDGNAIETVFIPEQKRGTLCVSSQVGCALNCSFCSTGKEGFNRNLSTAEIIGQLWAAVRKLAPEGLNENHAITNVVMMGMGEPLLNYEAVVPAMKLMMEDHAYALSKYRVTLSTAGVVPMMKRLRDETEVSLAVSLHAPNDELRNQLVPLNRKYPLKELMPVCREYYSPQSKRQVTFEYVMLDGINDSLSHAKELIRLLQGVPCKFNLIPFNPFPKTLYKTSSEATINQFQNTLIAAGIPTWVRKTRGDDIDAACGQLAGKIYDRTGRHQRWERTGKLVPVND